MCLRKHLEPAVAARVDELLVRHRSSKPEEYQKMQEVLEQMEEDTGMVLEKYMELWNAWSSEELFYVYENAFADGVRMMLHILTTK